MAHLHSNKEDIHTSDSDGEDIPTLTNKVVVESSDESTESHKDHCRNKSFDSSSDSDGSGPPGLIDRPFDDSSAESEVDIPHVSSGRNCDKKNLPKLLNRDRAKIDSSDESDVSSGHNSGKNILPPLLNRNRAKVDSSDESEPEDQPTPVDSSDESEPEDQPTPSGDFPSKDSRLSKNTLPKLLDRNRAQVDSSDESEPKDQPTPSGDSPSKDSRLELPFHLHPSTPFNATVNGTRRPGFSAHQDAHRERGSEIVCSEDIVSTNN